MNKYQKAISLIEKYYKNNIVIKLSSNFTEDTLNFVLDFLQNKTSQNIKFVDVRIDKQIITND